MMKYLKKNYTKNYILNHEAINEEQRKAILKDKEKLGEYHKIFKYFYYASILIYSGIIIY